MSSKPSVDVNPLHINYEAQECAFCRGRGTHDGTSRDINSKPCVACNGAGSVLVLKSSMLCSFCSGTGTHDGTSRDVRSRPCSACKGYGWAHAISSSTLLDNNMAQHGQLGSEKELRQLASLTSTIASELSATAYMVGYAFAFGLNWSNKETVWLECLLYALFSWVNVGYLLASRAGT